MRPGFMKALAVLVLLLMLDGALRRTRAAEPDWSSYTSQDGGYLVTIPGRPLEVTKTLNGGSGPIILHYVGSQPNRGAESYGVAYMDFGGAFLKPRVAAAALERMSNQFPGQVLSRRTISVLGFPGREIRLKVPRGVTTVRAFLVKRRLYQLIATSPREEAMASLRTKFMDSFKLLGKP